jgi:hypothetical protein
MGTWTDGWIQTLAGGTIETGIGTEVVPGIDTRQEGMMTGTSM